MTLEFPDIPRRFQSGPLALEWVAVLYEVARHLTSTLELGAVLGKVLNLTIESVGAVKGSIFLLDANGKVIRSILARGDVPRDIIRPTLETVMSQGFAGWVYRHQEAGIIFDTHSDSRWLTLPDDPIATRSAMGAPLIRRNQVIGIITMMHPEPHAFAEAQLELLEAIAGHAAAAVENAALYTRVNDERSVLRAIIAGVRDVILVTDVQDRLLLANPEAQSYLDLDEDDQGMPMVEVIAEPALQALYTSTRGEEYVRREVTFNDGRVFDCAVVRVPHVGRVLGLHDVTTFKQLDALKSEFVAHVSHDLKSPLAVIQAYAWMLDRAPDVNEEARGYIQQIKLSVDQMRSLIDHVLDMGRIEMGVEADAGGVRLAAVAQEVVASMQALAHEKKVALKTDLGAPTPPVKGSRLRLGQAVSNLVGNALKFTPSGGSVTVNVASDGDRVALRVTDTGPGIPPALQARLFQKFSRLRQPATSDQEGHGLGLAIVKSLVEAYGGQVWVESQAGHGSTFAFSLPLHKPNADGI